MRKFLTTIFFTLPSLLAFAQKAPIKFGDITLEEVKMTRYEKDTAAAAVILADYGVSIIDYNQSNGWFKLKFERTTRIKILKTDGYSYADFEIPLYHNSSDKEEVSGLKVVTYNLENGKIVETKMKSDAVFREKYDQNLDLQKFTAPNIKEGSVIEVTYKIDSDFLSYFRDWEFQSRIPVLWSEYRAVIPEYFNYEKFTQGYVALAVNESKDIAKSFSITSKERSGTNVTQTTYQTDNINYTAKNYRWAVSEAPAFRDEPFMTTYQDYISKINFELSYYKFPNEPIKQIMGTWSDLNKSLLESDYFGIAVNGSGFLKNITETVTAGQTTDQGKVASIYDYVKSNVAWDGRYRKFIDNNFKKVLDEKKGSSAEVNLLLVSMLQKAGMNADPVIISTRNNGFVREQMAISSQFNYVICQVSVDGKKILLDATDRMLPIHILPERCLNGRGYVISEERSGWVVLNAPKSKLYTSAEVSFTSDGQLKGKMTISNDGYFGQKARNDYFRKGEEEYVKDFAHHKSWEVEKSEFDNMKSLGESAKETYEFTHQDNFGDANVLYINPMLHHRLEENPFKLEERTYPVDFGYASDRTFSCRIMVPDNFTVEELPQSKVFALPNNAARYTSSIQVNGNVISFTSMLSNNQSLFAQTEYANLREFYNQVVAKQAEQIVLKKK